MPFSIIVLADRLLLITQTYLLPPLYAFDIQLWRYFAFLVLFKVL